MMLINDSTVHITLPPNNPYPSPLLPALPCLFPYMISCVCHVNNVEYTEYVFVGEYIYTSVVYMILSHTSPC